MAQPMILYVKSSYGVWRRRDFSIPIQSVAQRFIRSIRGQNPLPNPLLRIRCSFSVQQRAGGALLILGDGAGRAGARFDRIAVIAARAGVYTIEHIFHTGQR